MNCPECNLPMYYTGEHYPTITPQRFYACANKHMGLVRNQKEADVDWGDGSITKAWRAAIADKTSNEWKMVRF